MSVCGVALCVLLGIHPIRCTHAPVQCMYHVGKIPVQAVHATHDCVSGHVVRKAGVWTCVVKVTLTLNPTTLHVLSIVCVVSTCTLTMCCVCV